MAKVNASSSSGGTCPIAVSTASSPATTTKYSCTQSRSLRRSNASDSTPAASENSTMGSVAAVCTSETIVAAFGSLMNSHCAPTVCAQEPTLLKTTPTHSHRNALLWNGSKTPDRRLRLSRLTHLGPSSLRCTQNDRGMCGT